MASKRTIAVAGARLAGGVVTAAALVAVLIGVTAVSLPSFVVSAPAETIDPIPVPPSAVCAGPIVELSNDAGEVATTASSVGSATITSAASDATVDLSEVFLAAPDNATASQGSVPVALTSEGSAADVTIGAAQSQIVADSDLAGLAATACAEPSADSWLVGGATTVGRTSFVLLSNPTEVAATVSLTIIAEGGPVDAPGASAINVPAGSQRIVSLAGLAPDVASPIVHVVSTGGSVVASLQQSVIRGLEPGGIELVGQATAPATEQVLVGVQISTTSAIAERLKADGESDLSSALRVYVPGTTDANLSVTVSSEKAGAEDVSYTLSAAAGRVSDLPIGDLPDGTYSLVVASDVPILAGARTSVLANGVVDLAWYPALPTVEAEFVVPVATGPTPRIHVYNASATDSTLSITPETGDEITLTVPAGGTAGVDVKQDTTYSAVASAPLTVSVGFSGSGRLAAYGILPPNPAAAPVVVYP